MASQKQDKSIFYFSPRTSQSIKEEGRSSISIVVAFVAAAAAAFSTFLFLAQSQCSCLSRQAGALSKRRRSKQGTPINPFIGCNCNKQPATAAEKNNKDTSFSLLDAFCSDAAAAAASMSASGCNQ